AGRQRAARLAADPRQRVPGDSRDDGHGQTRGGGILRAASAAFLFQRVLDRGAAGAERGAALPGGLRRHSLRRAGDQLDEAPHGTDVGQRGDAGPRRLRAAVQAGGGDGGGGGGVRRVRRGEGRGDRESARMRIRPEGAGGDGGGGLRRVHGE